ncbi:MAG: DTW domain-containing protein [Gammaproteobacteria bacterium]|nr:DTW domain-containing protein [Gammaproteobacteria bacterium]
MNKRARCAHCLRAPVACFCHTIKSLDNQVKLVILQHPSEVKHAKGTAKIVELSLTHRQIMIGEDFSANDEFNALFNNDQQVLLLYPQDNAISPRQLKQQLEADSSVKLSHITIIVLDGSWKKAYKIYCLNPLLQSLPCIGITPSDQSNYRIRKSSRSDSLSTVEACYQLLTELEGDSLNFEPLLNTFNVMVEQQLNSMPAQVRSRYD